LRSLNKYTQNHRFAMSTNNSESTTNINNSNKIYKTLIGAAVGVVVLVGGYFGYNEFIAKPNIEKAESVLFYPEHWYEMDSLDYVLNGDDQNIGVLQIINKYGSTPAGNKAKMYAGMSYLKKGDFDNAIKYLEQFNGENTPVAYTVYGSIGDAYMEKGDIEKGISYYKKAIDANNEAISPIYLYRAAKASQLANKTEEAISYYKQLKNEYPFSQNAREAEKALGVLGYTEVE
jgi:tetratricopeptide (TPR) repeat protein